MPHSQKTGRPGDPRPPARCEKKEMPLRCASSFPRSIPHSKSKLGRYIALFVGFLCTFFRTIGAIALCKNTSIQIKCIPHYIGIDIHDIMSSSEPAGACSRKASGEWRSQAVPVI